VNEPLVPVALLRRRSVAWGNVAGVVAFATETSLVFLLTLYLQKVLGFSPLEAGLTFSVLGAGTVIGGLLGPRVIAVRGAKAAVVSGLTVQAAATAPLLLLGDASDRMPLLLVATFLGGIANLVAIVGFMVTVTGGVPDHEQGLVTGLATMSQQIGITMGIPVMSAIATTAMGTAGGAGSVLTGVRAAILVDVLLALACAGLVAVFHRADEGRPS
jgi:predicted MFS family arabinose efflux permease